MKPYKGVEIPTTGSEWELYTSSMACGRAAQALTAALKRAFRTFDKEMRSGKSAVAALGVAGTEMSQALRKYREFGAEDTEPRYHAAQALIDYAKLRVFGSTDGYHPELGDMMPL